MTPSTAPALETPQFPPADAQHPTSDLDLNLIWPDSETLFQSIMSADTADQWQIPLGTLPFPPVVQDVTGLAFGSPNSFDDRSASIGTIPSGGGHQAVRDVTEMVTSSVSGRDVLAYSSRPRLTYFGSPLASQPLSSPRPLRRCFWMNVCICSLFGSSRHSQYCTVQPLCFGSVLILFCSMQSPLGLCT